ncbi:MAG: MBL fold metallo-hydrolase [Gaiellales bacterium]
MAEPREIAERAEPVIPGVWTWRVSNSNIGGATSSCHALAWDDGSVLIDPLRLAPGELAALPQPVAICLTAKCHQRSAWRYRAEFGAEVWAPEHSPPMDEQPDRRYAEGDRLPGGLLALRTPGPEQIHYCLLLERPPGVLFCSDLLMSRPQGGLAFVPGEYHDDPAETRHSVERLADLSFEVLCLDHGIPITEGAGRAIAELLAES